MSNPAYGHRVHSGVGSMPTLLAFTGTESIISVMLAGYDANDFAFVAGPSVPGTSAGGAIFPAGALLGCPQTSGASYQRAQDASVGQPVTPANKLYYSYQLTARANRGRAGNATIPAQPISHAVVLAKDVDLTDNGTIGSGSDVPILVPAYWSGAFKAHSIKQDAEGFAADTGWPTSEIAGRISIVPTI